MSDERIEAAVAQAVSQAYESWAVEHPSLATVINRMSISEQAATSLRQSPEFRQAVIDFGKSRSELAFLGQLLELAAPILRGLVGI